MSDPKRTRLRSRPRAALVGILGLALGALLSPALTAAAASPDPCSSTVDTTGGRVSNVELYRYLACTSADQRQRNDDQDAALARIEAQLGSPSPSATPTPDQPTPTSSTSSTPSATPTPTPTASPTPTVTPTPTPTPTATAGPGTSALSLPVDPKFVGNEYFTQFKNAPDLAREDVWPIGIFYGNFDNASQAKWDVDHGINYHVEGQNSLTYPGDYSSQICFTTDELDGRNSDRNAVVNEMLNGVHTGPDQHEGINDCKAQGRVPYTNYTGLVTSDAGGDANLPYWKKLLNLGGAMSVDGYYYTDPSCDSSNRTDFQHRAPDDAHCRSASSYGQFIDTIRERDDAAYAPAFGFVEDGAPAQNGKYITPTQLDGAAWSVVNNGGAPIYFNNSFSGGCQSSGVLRSAQFGQKDASGRDCYGAIAAQMQKTNAAIQSYARVLNSPTYTWDFKAGKTDTLLKAYNGYGWIFSGVGLNGDAGSRTFTLPSDLAGADSVTDESGRTFSVSGGKFTDASGYPNRESHHVYKISLG